MQTPYTAAQKKSKRIQIQRALTGCYLSEYRLALIIGTEEHKVAVEMVNENDSQIVGGEFRGAYEWFAPRQDTMPYGEFQWNNGFKINPRKY